jgi:hypothetical protein
MRNRRIENGAPRQRGAIGAFAAAMAVCTLAALPAFAWGGSDQGGAGDSQGGSEPTDSQNDAAAGGDETVGTLPIRGGGRISLPITRDARGIQPSFYVEGRAADLYLTIQGARGHGYISLEPVEPLTGRVRMTFHGNVLVTLDRELASALRIDFGVAVPARFGNGSATVTTGTGAARALRLRPGFLPLPVASMTGLAAPDQSLLQLATSNRNGIHSTHTVMTTLDRVILGQQ